MRNLVFMLLVYGACQCPPPGLPHLEPIDVGSVFESGKEGYACFRIPAIVGTPSGHLLAFAEGRTDGCSDTGDIDLVMKRSEDGGKSWSGLQVVWDDSINTCGNPAPVVDHQGKVHLLTTRNLGTDHEREIIDGTSIDTRRIFYLSSLDEGATWSNPLEITNSVKEKNWTWYATGPGSGWQITGGPYAGRLLIACDHIEAASKQYYSHVIYSDDLGLSWQLGGSSPHDLVNECEIAQLSDDRLILNMRNYDRQNMYRQTAISEDGGLTWHSQHHNKALVEPICQASLQSLRTANESYLVFSNPARSDQRSNMTVKLSIDDGQSWPVEVLLHEGPSAYSDLVVHDDHVGCLYEKGVSNPYEQIVYHRFSLVVP